MLVISLDRNIEYLDNQHIISDKWRDCFYTILDNTPLAPSPISQTCPEENLLLDKDEFIKYIHALRCIIYSELTNQESIIPNMSVDELALRFKVEEYVNLRQTLDIRYSFYYDELPMKHLSTAVSYYKKYGCNLTYTAYLVTGRKQPWPTNPPDGWTEIAWKRFDYVETGIFEKSGTLTKEDREFLTMYHDTPTDWISPYN